MTQDPRNFTAASHEALADPNLKVALGRLKTHFQLGRTYAAANFGDFEALREQGRAIRDYSLSRLDTLLETFETGVTARGGHVHWARDAKEAREIILAILREADAKTVTKGKSMVSEEIELNPFLEANGITPVETDLGEYIIQLRHEPPSHIIAPAFHLSKEQVADSFRAAHTMLEPDRPLTERNALVAEARRMLRASFEAADAGITGANFLMRRRRRGHASSPMRAMATSRGCCRARTSYSRELKRSCPISTMRRCCCASSRVRRRDRRSRAM